MLTAYSSYRRQSPCQPDAISCIRGNTARVSSIWIKWKVLFRISFFQNPQPPEQHLYGFNSNILTFMVHNCTFYLPSASMSSTNGDRAKADVFFFQCHAQTTRQSITNVKRRSLVMSNGKASPASNAQTFNQPINQPGWR